MLSNSWEPLTFPPLFPSVNPQQRHTLKIVSNSSEKAGSEDVFSSSCCIPVKAFSWWRRKYLHPAPSTPLIAGPVKIHHCSVQSWEEHVTWHIQLTARWEAGFSRQSDGFTLLPVVFVSSVVMLWLGVIWFKLQIPGFAAAVKIPGIATVILMMLRDTHQSKHMLFPALSKMQEQTRPKLIGK